MCGCARAIRAVRGPERRDLRPGLGRERRLERRRRLLEPHDDQLELQRLLVREVLVERRRLHAQVGGEPAHRQRRLAVAFEDPPGRLDDLASSRAQPGLRPEGRSRGAKPSPRPPARPGPGSWPRTRSAWPAGCSGGRTAAGSRGTAPTARTGSGCPPSIGCSSNRCAPSNRCGTPRACRAIRTRAPGSSTVTVRRHRHAAAARRLQASPKPGTHRPARPRST